MHTSDSGDETMIVVYSREGVPEVSVGMPVPVVDEALEDVVIRFAPVAIWDSVKIERNPPEVGTSGFIICDKTEDDLSLEELKALKKNLARDACHEARNEPVTAEGLSFTPDAETMALLSEYSRILASGEIQTVSWIDNDGVAKELDAAKVGLIRSQLAMRVNSLNGALIVFLEQVESAKTREEAKALNWTY